MTAKRYALAVGVALIGIGIALGLLIPLTVTGTAGDQSCGSPWTGGQPIVAAIYGSHGTNYRQLCDDARGPRGTIALVLIGAGAVVVGASFIRKPVTSPSSS